MFTMSGVGALDVLSLPPRHLLWTAALGALAQNYPEAADQAALIAGMQIAVGGVFEHLAQHEFGMLRGIVEEKLLDELRDVSKSTEKEGWDAPPELLSARVLGLLSAEGIEEETGDKRRGRALRVTPLVYSKERYTYKAKSDHPTIVYRLQRWSFERELEPGNHWVIVDMGTRHWYWQKEPP